MKSSGFLIVFVVWKKYMRKKIHVYHHILYTNLILCRQKWKKFGFWKDESPNEVRIFLGKHIFLRWNFVSVRFRNFSVTFVNICNVSESRFDIEACARKKLWLYDILTKRYYQNSERVNSLFLAFFGKTVDSKSDVIMMTKCCPIFYQLTIKCF